MSKTASCSPEATSQSLAVPSQLPVASSRPSGENSILVDIVCMSRQRPVELTRLAAPEADHPFLMTGDAGLAVGRDRHAQGTFVEGFSEWADFVSLSIPDANVLISGDQQLASLGDERRGIRFVARLADVLCRWRASTPGADIAILAGRYQSSAVG